jgi:hypothetical protein
MFLLGVYAVPSYSIKVTIFWNLTVDVRCGECRSNKSYRKGGRLNKGNTLYIIVCRECYPRGSTCYVFYYGCHADSNAVHYYVLGRLQL